MSSGLNILMRAFDSLGIPYSIEDNDDLKTMVLDSDQHKIKFYFDTDEFNELEVTGCGG